MQGIGEDRTDDRAFCPSDKLEESGRLCRSLLRRLVPERIIAKILGDDSSMLSRRDNVIFEDGFELFRVSRQ